MQIRSYAGRLLDRHHDCTLRVQLRDGSVVDVQPLPDDQEQAACIWGGSTVSYYRLPDGRRVYEGEQARYQYEEELLDAMAQAIAESMADYASD